MGLILTDAYVANLMDEQKIVAHSEESPAVATNIAPALAQVLQSFKEHANVQGKPTEVLISIKTGQTEHAFKIKVNNVSEIQEILKLASGHDERQA